MFRRNFLTSATAFIATLTVLPKKAFSRINLDRINNLKQLKRKINGLNLPGSSNFNNLMKVFNLIKKPDTPDAILRTKDTDSLSTAIKYAGKTKGTSDNLNIRMRCGGHSYEYFSMGKGIVCDVRDINHIDVNTSSNTAWVGSGLLLKDVIKGLGRYGKAIPTGSCPTVGVSGLTLGGGLGLKGRSWGLTCDSVRAMRVFLSDGSLVLVTPDNQYSDLYWAMLGGGGGNFGLVYDFQFELKDKVNEILYYYSLPSNRFNEIMAAFENDACLGSDKISAILQISALKDKNDLSISLIGTHNDYRGGDMASVLRKAGLGKFIDMKTKTRILKSRPSDSVRSDDEPIIFKTKSHYSKNGLGNVESYELIRDTLLKNRFTSKANPVMIFGALGGKYDSPKYSNSYPHRNCRFSIEYYRNWGSSTHTKSYSDQLDKIFKEIDPIMDKKAYVNYPDASLTDWAQRCYGDSLERLLQIKKKYDPNHVFNFGAHSLSSLIKG